MGTNCAPLVADLCLFCYERLHAVSVRNNQTDILLKLLTLRLDILMTYLILIFLFLTNDRSNISHSTSVE